MKPQQRTAVLRDIVLRLGAAVDYVNSVYEQLVSAQLLLTGPTPETERFERIRRQWAELGWAAAADYHLLTYDYEYVDEVGLDAQIMHEYLSQEPDTERYKTYPGVPRLPLPRPTADLIPIPFAEGWLGSPLRRDLTFATLASLLATVFGKISALPGSQAGTAALMHRSSPSGGARHPTEGYLLALTVPDLSRGWYHIRVDEPCLEYMDADADQSGSERVFIQPFRAPFQVRAIVVLTSRFERNMYRYREPRTLRTVFMDAGHLAGSLEIAAGGLGIATSLLLGLDDGAFEDRLRLSGIEEGLILAIALG